MNSNNRKYELTDDTICILGRTLHRIRALRDIETNIMIVKTGDLGGYIESVNNLDHDGNAWVFGDARVSGDAQVFGDARVSGNAWVSGNARVSGNAWVSGDAWVSAPNHLLVIGPIGSRSDYTTFAQSSTGIVVMCGCFVGTIEKFCRAVTERHGSSKHGKLYGMAIDIAKEHIGEVQNDGAN